MDKKTMKSKGQKKKKKKKKSPSVRERNNTLD